MSASELSRMVKVRPLPAKPVVIEADDAERSALASRFALASISSLSAEMSLESAATDAVLANGKMHAKFTQICAVSGEEFPVEVSEEIALKFVDAETTRAALADASEDLEIELSGEDLDEIEYSGDAFDLGEAVAQSLGLAIDPYAEGPNADAVRTKAGIVAEGEQDGPMAEMLAALKKS